MSRASLAGSIQLVDSFIVQTGPRAADSKGAPEVKSKSRRPPWKGMYPYLSTEQSNERNSAGEMERRFFPALWGGRGTGADLIAPNRQPTTVIGCDDIWISGQRDMLRSTAAAYEGNPKTESDEERQGRGEGISRTTDASEPGLRYVSEAFRCNVVQPAAFVLAASEHARDGDPSARQLPPIPPAEMRRRFYDTIAEEKAIEQSLLALKARSKLYGACRANYPNGALGLKENPFSDPGNVYDSTSARQQAFDSRRLRGDGGNAYPRDTMFGPHILPQSSLSVGSEPGRSIPSTMPSVADKDGWRPSANTESTPQDHFRGAVQWRDEDGVRKHRLYYM